MAIVRIRADQILDNIVLIKRGDVAGFTFRRRHFFTLEASTSFFSTIWAATPAPSYYPWLAAAQVLQVSSSSANDTAAGAGCRTVLIEGLDANYNLLSETVTLNGTAGVSTVNSYLRINNVTAQTFGGMQFNDGGIYVGSGIITAGVNSSAQGFILPRLIYSEVAALTVPAGYTFVVFNNEMSVNAGKEAIIRLIVRTSASSPWQLLASNNLFGTRNEVDTGFKILYERSDIEYRVLADAAKTHANCEVEMVFIDNKFL